MDVLTQQRVERRTQEILHEAASRFPKVQESDGQVIALSRLLSEKEGMRVITVRLPPSYYRLLQDEAHDERTSLNKLCVRRLLREEVAAAARLAAEQEHAAGRRPVPAGAEPEPPRPAA